MYFEDAIDEVKYSGQLFGLGSSLFQNGIPYDAYINPQTLVAVAQSVAASANSHNSASQSSMANLANSMNGNNNSSSTPNLSNLNGSNDLSKFYIY